MQVRMLNPTLQPPMVTKKNRCAKAVQIRSTRRITIKIIVQFVILGIGSNLVRIGLAAFSLFFAASGLAQPLSDSPISVTVERLDNGLSQVGSELITILTDLPVDENIRDLPEIFRQALPQWARRFRVSLDDQPAIQVTVYLMKDRQRFAELGLLAGDLPNFRFGYQQQDRLFVTDQPSAYYIRHLFLHEATHWFLWKYLGGNGPPWFSEGLCESLATHTWSDKELQLAVIPAASDDVPYWGRLKIIRDNLRDQKAPSLEEILAYSDMAHRSDEPYGWSWAAVLFFSSHPNYQKSFEKSLQAPIGVTDQPTRRIRSDLGQQWTSVQIAWNGFLSDLDYGYDPAQSWIDIDIDKATELQKPVVAKVEASRGWQSTNLVIRKGAAVRVRATGKIVVQPATAPSQIIRDEEKNGSDPNKEARQTAEVADDWDRPVEWISEPAGITVEYQRGQPIGKLVATIAPCHLDSIGSVNEEDNKAVNKNLPSATWKSIPIGNDYQWIAEETGILFLKVNEISSRLQDNSGQFTVQIAPVRKPSQ